MARLLFGMSDAEIDSEWERQSERMWEAQFPDENECCKYCYHYNCPFCTYDDDDQPEMDEDDYCEHFQAEEFYPGEEW